MRNYEAIEEHIIGILKSNLPPNLFYHGVHHTYDVLNSALLITGEEKVTAEELFLLKVAILYHDAGFISTYLQHEEASCLMAKKDLPGFGLNAAEIEVICGMIMATKIPQKPHTKLEKIIADADLEYLGTDKFDQIGNTLFEEGRIYMNIKTQRQWDEIQVHFLTGHHYYTGFCIRNREEGKQKHLREVEKRLEAE
jgi:uncharacterized protein